MVLSFIVAHYFKLQKIIFHLGPFFKSCQDVPSLPPRVKIHLENSWPKCLVRKIKKWETSEKWLNFAPHRKFFPWRIPSQNFPPHKKSSYTPPIANAVCKQ